MVRVLYYAMLQMNLQSDDNILKTPQRMWVASYEAPTMSQTKLQYIQIWGPQHSGVKMRGWLKVVKKIIFTLHNAYKFKI